MNDMLQAIVEMATDPVRGVVALTWLIMANTALGVVLALVRHEFQWDRLLSFLGGERVVLGGAALALIGAGLMFQLPLLPFYQFVAGAIAVSTAADITSKVVAIVKPQATENGK